MSSADARMFSNRAAPLPNFVIFRPVAVTGPWKFSRLENAVTTSRSSERITGVEMVWTPCSAVMFAGPLLESSVSGLMPAIVYDWELRKLMAPTVRGESSATVTGEPMTAPKRATCPPPLGTPPLQLAASLQLPLALMFHVGAAV